MANVSQVAASTAEKAGFWRRIPACALDTGILFIVYGIVYQAILERMAAGWIWPLIDLVLGAGYFSYLWSGASPLGAGRTVGSLVYGLRVIRTDGSDLTLVQGLIRWAGLLLSVMIAFIGVIWVAFDASKQGWHDKIAGTYVIQVRAKASDLTLVQRLVRWVFSRP
jgi:uncharacterized RDD family membrane protein YckC